MKETFGWVSLLGKPSKQVLNFCKFFSDEVIFYQVVAILGVKITQKCIRGVL